MKKLLILALILVGGVATADSTITSKQYVDAALNTLQSQIPAKNTDTVLTHTGTAGEIGEKKIYNANNSYGAQTDALVTAGAFNSAVQNALASEFVCTEWQGDVHDNAHCLLYEVRTATQSQILPDGFTQLEYLESTGTQYIDTNYKPNNLTNFEIKYLYTNFITATIANTPYGCTLAPDAQKANYGVFRTGPGSHTTYNRMAWGDASLGSNIALSGNIQRIDTWYIDKYLQNKLYIDGNLVATSSTTLNTQWSAPNSLWLFARHADNYHLSYPSAIKIAYAKAWENTETKFNFVPARRNSDGKLGMYDLVSGGFFTNSGTDEFVAGPVASYFPQGN